MKSLYTVTIQKKRLGYDKDIRLVIAETKREAVDVAMISFDYDFMCTSVSSVQLRPYDMSLEDDVEITMPATTLSKTFASTKSRDAYHRKLNLKRGVKFYPFGFKKKE